MKIKNISVLIVLSLTLIHTMAFAIQGDPIAGKEKSATCAACHGPDGNGVSPAWPKLAGQHAEYLFNQMKEFKKGEAGKRYNEVMMPLMAALTEQDMADIAAYYASQITKIGAVKKSLLEQGAQLYRGGDIEKGISACIACHGPRGLGNPEAHFPKLSGQFPEYIVIQLQAYKNKQRKSDLHHIMQDISGRMSNEDMQAVASYIHGLH